MNQSNKALRGAVAELLWGISDLGAGMDDYGALPKDEQEVTINETTQLLIALVINHIKGALPEKSIAFGEGYNAAISEVTHILERLSK